MRVLLIRIKEAECLFSFLNPGFVSPSTMLVGHTELDCSKLEGKNVYRIEIHTPGNDKIIFYCFEDNSAIIKMEVITTSVTIIDGEVIPISKTIECNCRNKVVEFDLNMDDIKGYGNGFIKIFSDENSEVPETSINFDHFFYADLS